MYTIENTTPVPAPTQPRWPPWLVTYLSFLATIVAGASVPLVLG